MDCCSVTHSSQTSSTTLAAAARDDGMNRTRETMPRPKRFPAIFKCSENLQLMGLDLQRFYFIHQLNHRSIHSIRPNSSKFRQVTDWDPFHGSSCLWYIPVLVTYEALRYFRNHLSKDDWISGSWLRKTVLNSWMPWHGWSNCFLPLRQAGSFLAVWQVWLFHPVGDW